MNTRNFPPCRLALLLLLVTAFAQELDAATPYRVSITQIERVSSTRVGVYVAVTDSQGDPVATPASSSISITEQGREVLRRPVAASSVNSSQGIRIALAMDVSGSMRGEKLYKAKLAAREFARIRPGGCEITIVSFSDLIVTQCPFTADMSELSGAIDDLDAGGETAIQDAVGQCMESIHASAGRRAILLMTDGLENASVQYSGTSGLERLIQEAGRQSVTVATVGLGYDVDRDYLERFSETGGPYVESPTPADLEQVFQLLGKQLSNEIYVEFDSSLPQNGMRRALRASLVVGTDVFQSAKFDYVAPGFIPRLQSNPVALMTGIIALLWLPSLVIFVGGIVTTFAFRRRSVRRLRPGDPQVGQVPLNASSGHDPFRIGDLVISCPCCDHVSSPRAWRWNRCQCARADGGAGRYCYAGRLPKWLRKLLARLPLQTHPEHGSRWLCRCAGDSKGY